MPCRSPRGYVSQHALQVSRPTPKWELEGSGWGVSRPTPRGKVEGFGWGGLQAHTWAGGVSQHALRQTPPHRTATAAGGIHPTGMHSC